MACTLAIDDAGVRIVADSPRAMMKLTLVIAKLVGNSLQACHGCVCMGVYSYSPAIRRFGTKPLKWASS